MWFRIASADFDFLGLPKGPKRLEIGSSSSSSFRERSRLEVEILVPIEEFVSAPIIWVVFFCDSILLRKVDRSLLNESISFSL